MQNPEHPSPSLTRRDLEDAWRVRSEMARERYNRATLRYRKLLEAKSEGATPRPDGPLVLARHAESRALAEYRRILKIFTELIAHDRIPEEESAAGADGGQNLTDGTLVSVVDDDESIRDSTRILLRSAGYEVSTFESGELFLESDTLPETGCLILDIRMSGMSGLEVQRRVNLSEPGIPVIFVTAHDDKTTRKLAFEAGASELFQKPFSANDFLAAIHTALKKRADRLAGGTRN